MAYSAPTELGRIVCRFYKHLAPTALGISRVASSIPGYPTPKATAISSDSLLAQRHDGIDFACMTSGKSAGHHRRQEERERYGAEDDWIDGADAIERGLHCPADQIGANESHRYSEQ